MKFIWFVRFVSPFLHTLTLISFNFYTVICYHLLLGVNQLGYFVSLGGYFDDNLAVLCGIAFMDLECDQPEINFNFCWVHWVPVNFCFEINFAILHCILNLESIIFLTAFVAIFTIFEHYWHKFFVYLCWVTHVLCHWWPWKFCCVENCLMLSEDDKIDLSSVAVTELQKCLEKSGEHMVFIQLWFSRALCLATWLAFFLHILIFVFMYISFKETNSLLTTSIRKELQDHITVFCF